MAYNLGDIWGFNPSIVAINFEYWTISFPLQRFTGQVAMYLLPSQASIAFPKLQYELFLVYDLWH